MSLERIRTEEFTTQDDYGNPIKATRRITLVPKNVKKRENWSRFGIAATKKSYDGGETISIKPEFSTEFFVRSSELAEATRKEKTEEELELERLKHQKEQALQNLTTAPPAGQPGATDLARPAPGAYVPRMLRSDGPSASRGFEEINTTIKVANLGKEVDEFILREIFKTFGTITRCYLVRETFINEYGEREKGDSRGFAFVTFATESQAHKAISEMHGKILNHTLIDVEMSKPRT
mmetsp:Transcript_4944/g.18612  ORF Transcript_4944/g.18612 Transcript_4944/m.18612 type:complete len:236 (-) Transcript_4944:2362-3069(-)